MSSNSKKKNLAERLKAGLEEGILYAQDDLNLRTVEIPSAPPKFTAKKVLHLRKSARMSQTVFARLINVSPKTVQSWEQGQRIPSQAAQRMLQVLQEKPNLVLQVVGMLRERKKHKIGVPN